MMNKSAAERAETSRQNGQKSRGPQSAAGKDRSRFNALKHGLKAKVVVLPGEDAQEYQGRLDAWIADWQPANDVEHALVERAVTLTWQLDRAERAETARLAALIRSAPAEEACRQEDEARALGQRLFFDRRGPLPLYPHSLYSLPNRPRTSFSGLSDDPDDPPRLLLRLEATAAGCQWLLDRWAELRGLLDRGLTWQSPDTLRAIRLLGHQPLDAADSEVVATIFQACHVLDPQSHHQAGVATDEVVKWAAGVRTLKTMGEAALAGLGDEPGFRAVAEPELDLELDETSARDIDEAEKAEARIAWQRCGAAFTELLGELSAEEGDEYRRRLMGRRVDQLRPRNKTAARATLRAIVEKAVIRLEAKQEVHQERAAMEADAVVDRLHFDASEDGERLRRFQLAGQRALIRTVDSLLKLRRAEQPRQTDRDPGEPPPSGARVDRLAATIDCGLGGLQLALGDELLPAVADLCTGPPPTPEAENNERNWQNEPAADVVELPIAPAEPAAPPAVHPLAADEPAQAIPDHTISPNEPAAQAGDDPVVPDEPSPPAEGPRHHQEPNEPRRRDNPPPRDFVGALPSDRQPPLQ